MWEHIWNHENLELHMDASDKRAALHIKSTDPMSNEAAFIHLDQSHLIEMISALLTINRCFQGEKPFFED
jgi:hypothetical protein